MPLDPIEIPAEAFAALDLLRDALQLIVPEGTQFGIGLDRDEITGDPIDELVLKIGVVIGDAALPEFPMPALGLPVRIVAIDSAPISDESKYDTLRGGILISRPGEIIGGAYQPHTGTLGAVVRRRTDGETQFLTCQHVVTPTTGPGPTPIFQPEQKTPGATQVGTADRSNGPLDAAVITPNHSRPVDHAIVEVGYMRGVAAPSSTLCMPVHKRGATTGHTSGITTDHWPLPDGTPGFFDVYHPHRFAAEGDSGSIVLDVHNRAVGLLTSVNFVFDPVTKLLKLDAYGRRIYDGRFGRASLMTAVQDALGIDVIVDPFIDRVNPPNAFGMIGGGFIVIDGGGFAAPNSVTFDGLPAVVLVQTPTQLRVVPPVHNPGEVQIVVTNKFGDRSVPDASSKFTYDKLF